MKKASKDDTRLVVSGVIQDIEKKNPKGEAHNCELTREYFGPLLKELFNTDYKLHKPGELVKKAEDARNAYITSTDELKNQYRTQKTIKLVGQAVTAAGQ